MYHYIFTAFGIFQCNKLFFSLFFGDALALLKMKIYSSALSMQMWLWTRYFFFKLNDCTWIMKMRSANTKNCHLFRWKIENKFSRRQSNMETVFGHKKENSNPFDSKAIFFEWKINQRLALALNLIITSGKLFNIFIISLRQWIFVITIFSYLVFYSLLITAIYKKLISFIFKCLCWHP